MQHLGTIGEYIRTELEPDGRGFEHFLEQKRTIAPRWRHVIRFGSDYGSWICLFLFNIAGLEWGPRLSCLAATKLEGVKLPF